MMLVNNPGNWGAMYAPLKHAEWHGWTFTDTIFPFFLWIVGVAIPFSLVRRLEAGERPLSFFPRIIRRTLLLIGLGLFLSGFPFFEWETLRFPGVLQRIGVCYFVASIVVLYAGVRGQILWTLAFLILSGLLLTFGSMPGFPPGDLSKEGNFSHYVDSLLLKGHMWKSTKTWDPEGIVSTLPAISTTLFGVLTGHLLRSNKSPAEKTAWMFVFGSLLMFAGQLLHLWMPINKPIWTSSYAVFMSGLAATVLAVCYWLVDVQQWQKWSKPFAIYGVNAITVFVLAGLLGRLSTVIKVTNDAGKEVALKTFLFESYFAPLASPKNASLLWALMYVLGLYLVAWVLYRKKWFIRL